MQSGRGNGAYFMYISDSFVRSFELNPIPECFKLSKFTVVWESYVALHVELHILEDKTQGTTLSHGSQSLLLRRQYDLLRDLLVRPAANKRKEQCHTTSLTD